MLVAPGSVVLAPDSTIGSYRLIAVRGQGGMGVVYEATHTGLDVRRAIKVIAPALADDPSFRERFKRESQLAASIEHPNVITIHDFGEWQGVLYIAMQYVDGTDLRELVSRQGRLDPRRAARIVSQIASALDAAHQRGLVHRDVKPANVLIVDEGTRDHALLTDFGLTKRATSMAGLTQTGHWVGSPDFVAPEQLEGRPVDARTDVYALGALTYYAITGQVPYPREHDMAKLYAHVNDSPPRLPRGSVPDHVAPGLQEVISRAMAKDPAERYGTAGEAADATVSAADVSAPPTRPAAMQPPPAPEAAPTAPGHYAPPPPRYASVSGRRAPRRGRWVVGAAAVIALAIAASAVAILAGSSEEDATSPRTQDDRAAPGRPTVQSKDRAFAVELPSGWTRGDARDKDLELFGPGDRSRRFNTNVLVSHYPRDGVSLSEESAATIEALEDDGFRVDRRRAESTTVDGEPAQRHTYTLVRSERGEPDARGRQLIIARGDLFYLVTFTDHGEHFDRNVAAFEQLMNSWRWRSAP
jgi:hypothetical protein